MSRDPIRLVDLHEPPSPGAEFVRDLIRDQEGLQPPCGKMEELARTLGPILQANPPTTRPTSRLGVTAAAVATAVLIGGILWTTTNSAKDVQPVDASAQAHPIDRPSRPAERPLAMPAEVDGPPVATVSVDALPSAEVRKAPSVTPTALRCDDVTLVDGADTALRAGNPERALAAAREHEQRCPTGALVQERERIAIEALVQLGRIDQARARASAFEARFPSSPHVGRIRQALERVPR